MAKRIAFVSILMVIAAFIGVFVLKFWTKGVGTEQAQKTEMASADPQVVTESEADNDSDNGDVVSEAASDAADISGMSLREKVCQLFIVTPEALTGVENVSQAGDTTYEAMKKYPVGGLILNSNNLNSADQVISMTENLQDFSEEITGYPLFICVDEEGGNVSRVAVKLSGNTLSDMYTYRNEGAQTAMNNAEAIGEDILSYGFNLDFAPVADIWSNPDNTVIGQRAYSDDFKQGAQLIAAAVEGFHSARVLCTLKHFPGHGNTAEDSHKGSAYSYKTLDELRDDELLPFQAGILAGADFVMMGHITMRAVDDLPASLSSTMIQDVLRDELGFDGIVITDALSMDAVSKLYPSGELCVKALEVGNDMLLMPDDFKEGVDAICEAVEKGRISEDELNEKVQKIISVKGNI